MNLKKTISSIIKKYDVYIYVYFSFLSKIFYGCTNIHIDTRIDEEKKKEKKKSKRERKKSILFFQSHNNIRCSNSCVVDHHHTTSSSSSIELHKWMDVFRMTFSYSVCLTGFFAFFLDFFYYIIVLDEKKRPCFLSLIHSFTHLTLAETTYREQAEKNNITILD
jgi:hypothetical protein